MLGSDRLATGIGSRNSGPIGTHGKEVDMGKYVATARLTFVACLMAATAWAAPLKPELANQLR